MSLEVVPLGMEFLPEAADLVASRYRELLDEVPSLPRRYANPGTLLPLLAEIANRQHGVAARENGRLAGFLAAWPLPSFRGERAVFSPEWGHAAAPPGERRIYEAMYTHLAARWRDEGYLRHMISLFANRQACIECWHWMGLGMSAADAARDLSADGETACDAEIHLARPENIDSVMGLANALHRHIADSPSFLAGSRSPELSLWEDRLSGPASATWLARQGGKAVAFLGVGPASNDACTIIQDDRTASITGAYALPEARGHGIASCLLRRAVDWARTGGYTRCAVDFEPMNPPARRFWLRHFQPVCYTLSRHIDGIDR